MASERAKQLAAEQKAQVKAEKLRKRNSDDPKDWGALRQLWGALKLTAQFDKPVVPLMIGAFLLVVAIGLVIGFLWLSFWWLGLIFGVLFGLTAAMWMLSLRARTAMFKRVSGQPGAAEAALSLLNKKWVKNPVIAIDRYQDIVHRAIGPGGIVLIGEGQPQRVRDMLATEAKRHGNIKYNVPVTTIVMGKEKNQVPLEKLDKYIKKLPKVIQPTQVTEIQARLKALDGMRPRLPVPKGPLPTNLRGARAALRGR